MRRVFVLLAALALLAPAAHAASEPAPRGLTAVFGNTVKALYADGKAQRLWFKPDGTWEAVGRRGKWSAGKWSVREDRVCLKQSKPFAAPFRYCTELPPSSAPGVVWTSRDMYGETIRLTLVKGIERP